jgi:hypothetical protein
MYVRVAFEGTPGLLGPRCLGLLPKHIAGRLAGKQGYGERRERRSTNPHLMIDPTRGILPAGRRSSSFSKRNAARAQEPCWVGELRRRGGKTSGSLRFRLAEADGTMWGRPRRTRLKIRRDSPVVNPFPQELFLDVIASRHPLSAWLRWVQLPLQSLRESSAALLRLVGSRRLD